MLIGILKENLEYENRVAITANIVKSLLSSGHKVNIESGAGESSFVSDNDFTQAGAVISNKSDIFNADIIFKVNAPNSDELNSIKEGSTVISFFQISLPNLKS